MRGHVTLLVLAAAAEVSPLTAQVRPMDKPLRPTIVATASVRPADGFTVANGTWRMQTGYGEVMYYRTDPSGAAAILMHGAVPAQPTKSTISVVATGLKDAPYTVRVDFQKVYPAASITLRQVGGAGVSSTCSLAGMASGTQSCSLNTRLQGGGSLTFELIVETGTELIPSLVTLNQLSQ
jgi:hypothetical protein